MKQSAELHLPIEAIIGWIPRVDDEKDAIEYTKRQIEIHFSTPEISWYAVAPFDNGYLFEIHHGGRGKGYLKSLIENLRADPDGEYWIPSGNRATRIIMQEGEPLALVLPEDDARKLVQSGHPPLHATLSLKPAVAKGAAIFNFGAAMAGVGVVFFLGSAVFYAVAANPGPSVRAVDFAALPHSQWAMASSATVEEIVSKLEMKSDKWSVDKRRNIIEGLDDLRAKGRTIDAQNRQKQAVPTSPDNAADPAAGVIAPHPSATVAPDPAGVETTGEKK
ncbi:hypothetical protein G6L37_04145 [Agrobacterium rubi]|nr:hypothetical protein [Agrobacterium rubi]NTF24542.1 hypothetical protein [Agrobacterium rubi]